jgi:hypothetical protein
MVFARGREGPIHVDWRVTCFSFATMKSNRMRVGMPVIGAVNRFQHVWLSPICRKDTAAVALEQMPPPAPISKIKPDQVVEDILVSTLLRVQSSATPEIAAAAAKYLALLKAKVR